MTKVGLRVGHARSRVCIADPFPSADDRKPRKRGRPPKPRSAGAVSQSPNLPTPQHTPSSLPPPVRTPQAQAQPLPQQPAVNTPLKPTPAKTVVKALPTVRDHTTDQLNPEGDEYIPREYDDAGERKVSQNGHPLEGREYRCRTFLVPNRGNKLFMLATECARVLGYRDSYLLFNKNRSLYKIIASQAEKDDLIHQEILPYSYRSRQIAIVTARSMFRQFGSRVIVNGRRVRDDYWEGKARKQGFTEEDLAGEKRPGAAKARDAAAAEAASAASTATTHHHHQDIVYSPAPPHLDAQLQSQTIQPGMVGSISTGLAPLPMIQTDDLRLRDYGNVPRPRQELTGPPYQDRTQSSTTSEILNQAQQTADFNKALTQQRAARTKYMEDVWSKSRESPIAHAQPHGVVSTDQNQTGTSQASPQPASTGFYSTDSPSSMSAQHRALPQTYPQQSHQQSPLGHSPLRSVPGSIRPEHMHQRSIGHSSSPGSSLHGGNPYGISHQSHMWPPPPQPLQSPLSHAQPTHHALPQYSPHAQQHSPHQQPSHQGSLHQTGSQLPGTSLQYQGGLSNMGSSGYPSSAGRSLYQVGAGSQQYIHPSTSSSQPSLQGWAPPQQNTHGSQGWAWGSGG